MFAEKMAFRTAAEGNHETGTRVIFKINVATHCTVVLRAL